MQLLRKNTSSYDDLIFHTDMDTFTYPANVFPLSWEKPVVDVHFISFKNSKLFGKSQDTKILNNKVGLFYISDLDSC